MGEQAPLAVCDPSFGGANAATPAHHNAFCRDQARLRGDGPHQRNLEFEGRLADAFLQRRQYGQSHAAIEQRGRETAVHRASGIEVSVIRFRRDYDTPAHRLRHIIAQGLSDGIEGQRALDEPLDKLQAAHLFLPIGGNGPIRLAGGVEGQVRRQPIVRTAASLAGFGPRLQEEFGRPRGTC